MNTKKIIQKEKLDKMISFRINRNEFYQFKRLSKEQKILRSIKLREYIKKLLQSN